VIQTVRERFSCRQCEAIAQPPAPFYVMPRGFPGLSLLAMTLFGKFGQHQPLNRQSERYSRQVVDLSLSALADRVGQRRGAASAACADQGPCAFERATERRRQCAAQEHR
jgi:transposase